MNHESLKKNKIGIMNIQSPMIRLPPLNMHSDMNTQRKNRFTTFFGFFGLGVFLTTAISQGYLYKTIEGLKILYLTCFLFSFTKIIHEYRKENSKTEHESHSCQPRKSRRNTNKPRPSAVVNISHDVKLDKHGTLGILSLSPTRKELQLNCSLINSSIDFQKPKLISARKRLNDMKQLKYGLFVTGNYRSAKRTNIAFKSPRSTAIFFSEVRVERYF